MKYKFSKREIFIFVVYLLTIFFIGTGITFSFFLLIDGAEKDSTKVYAGTLDVKYVQGSQVSMDVLYPIPEPGFADTENVYRNAFSVNSNGTLEQNVQISFDISKNEFSKDSIRFALYNSNGRKVSTGYLNEGNAILVDNLYFKANETKDFVLIIWLEEKPYEQVSEQGCKLSGIIRIYSKQFGY